MKDVEMNQPEDSISKSKRRFETWTAFIKTTFIGVALLAFMGVCLVGIVAILAYKSHEDERQEHLYKPLQEAVANFKETSANLKLITENAAKGTAKIEPAIQALTDGLVEVKGAVADSRAHLATITASVDGRLHQLDGFIDKLGFVADEARAQVKQNGDESVRTIASLNTFVQHRDTEITALTAQGMLMVKTANEKTSRLLDDFDVVVIGDPDHPDDSLRGLVKKGNTAMADANGMLHNGNLLTADIQKKGHELLYPIPERGFKGFMKKFILRPITTFGGAAYLVERLIYNLP